MDHAQTAPASHGGIPKGAVIGVFTLLGFAILTTGFARVTDVGTSRMAAAQQVSVLPLLFEDAADGSVVIRTDKSDRPIRTLDPGSNGFIRATMRGFVRDRKLSGIGPQQPFFLIRWSDGSLSLEDRSTGRKADLDAFGPSNAGAFATLFQEADRS